MSPQIFFTKTVSKFRNDVNKARVELSEDRKNRYKKVDVYAERYQGATTYLKPCWPNSWSSFRGWMTTSFPISCPIDPTCPIWVPYLISMAWKRHLWSTNLALFTFLMLYDLIIFHLMSYSPYILNIGSLSSSYGLQEVPGVHWPGPGHLADVGWPHCWPFPVNKSHHAQSWVSLSSTRPNDLTGETSTNQKNSFARTLPAMFLIWSSHQVSAWSVQPSLESISNKTLEFSPLPKPQSLGLEKWP